MSCAQWSSPLLVEVRPSNDPWADRAGRATGGGGCPRDAVAEAGADGRDNGTTYRDEHYVSILAKASTNYSSWYRRSFNTVRDALGNRYLEVTIPAFQKFMRHWADGELVWLSDKCVPV